MHKLITPFFLFIFSLAALSCNAQHKSSELTWNQFTPEAFAKAKSENKYVLLDLMANWCHWCHVMDDSTYSDPAVIEYLNKHFVSTQADQDLRPDLANRYREYGWPATIFLAPDGTEIVKRAGYMSPDNFLMLLKAIVEDPSPEEESISIKKGKPLADDAVSTTLKARMVNTLDIAVGGFNQGQKYIEFDTYEYIINHVEENPDFATWLKNSIEGSYNLQDPVWGGVYQYSTHYDWNHLHFEKLLTIQARYITMYSWYYTTYKDEKAKQLAVKTAQYVTDFLSASENAKYNSQDADVIKGEHSETYFLSDDVTRRKQGIPSVDKNTFSSNNIRYAESLMHLWSITNKPAYLNEAKAIIDNILTRKNADGLISHVANQEGLVYFEEQLYTAKALLQYIKIDPSEVYRQELKNLLKFTAKSFMQEYGLFVSYLGNNGLNATPIVAENLRWARVLNLASHLLHTPMYKSWSAAIFNNYNSTGFLESIYSEPAYLMLREELQKEPMHAAFLFQNEDKKMDFVQAILAHPNGYMAIDHNGVSLSKQMNTDGFTNTLFFCTDTYCSSPIETKTQLLEFLQNL